MARLTKWDAVRECYVIVPDSTTNHIQKLGELEDRDEYKAVYADQFGNWHCPGCHEEFGLVDYDNPFCQHCGQRLKWSDD